MALLDEQKQRKIRTTGLLYLEYLIFGSYFILFNLLMIRVAFSEKTVWDLLLIIFIALFIPFVFVMGWRRKLITYDQGTMSIQAL